MKKVTIAALAAAALMCACGAPRSQSEPSAPAADEAAPPARFQSPFRIEASEGSRTLIVVAFDSGRFRFDSPGEGGASQTVILRGRGRGFIVLTDVDGDRQAYVQDQDDRDSFDYDDFPYNGLQFPSDSANVRRDGDCTAMGETGQKWLADRVESGETAAACILEGGIQIPLPGPGADSLDSSASQDANASTLRIIRGPQPASLFEIPFGYRRVTQQSQ